MEFVDTTLHLKKSMKLSILSSYREKLHKETYQQTIKIGNP